MTPTNQSIPQRLIAGHLTVLHRRPNGEIALISAIFTPPHPQPPQNPDSDPS